MKKHRLIYHKKPKDRAYRMAQQVNVLVAHPDDQSSILRIYMIEEELPLLFSLYTSAMLHVYALHINKQINVKKKIFKDAHSGAALFSYFGF